MRNYISDSVKTRWLEYLFNACEANFGHQDYYTKNLCIEDLAQELLHTNINWGWGIDERQGLHKHVIYIDTDEGQVSLHSEHRFIGPNYNRPWDGTRETHRRIRLLIAKTAREIFDTVEGWKARGYRLKLNHPSEWVVGYYHITDVTRRPLPPPKPPKIGKSRAEWKELGLRPKRSELKNPSDVEGGWNYGPFTRYFWTEEQVEPINSLTVQSTSKKRKH